MQFWSKTGQRKQRQDERTSIPELSKWNNKNLSNFVLLTERGRSEFREELLIKK